MKSRIVCTFVALAVVAAAFAPQVAEARGRGKPSPYVNTPYGRIPKSVYYSQNMQIADPAMIARMQQKEQQLANKNKKPGNTQGQKNTAGKPNAAKKK